MAWLSELDLTAGGDHYRCLENLSLDEQNNPQQRLSPNAEQ